MIADYLVFAYYISLPFLMAIGLAVGLIAIGVLGINRPRLLVYPFLIVLLTVSGNSFGTLDVAGRSIYSRGSGQLFYPVIYWMLLVGLLWTKVAQTFNKDRAQLACNLRPWLLWWSVLMAAHLVVGLMLGEDVMDILGLFGFVNVIWMGLFILFVVNAFSEPADVEELTRVVLLCALGRTLFGLVRWAAMGGDPANVYSNRGGIAVKLTFFDINDSLACLLGLVVAVVMLSRRGSKAPLGFFWTAVCWATIVLAPPCIALSYRRTAWIGIVLAGAFTLIFLTPRHRWIALLTAVPVGLVGLGVVASRRLSQTKGASGLGDFFFDLVGKSTGGLNQRQLELLLAWRDFTEHPLVGLGSWGRYSGSSLISWQQGAGDGAFLHSGFLHIALKSGTVGLVLFLGLFAAFGLFVWRRRAQVDHARLPLFVAGAAGVLFLLPDMAAGTPIPQVRTMLVWGLCFALPYVAARRLRAEEKSTPPLHPLVRQPLLPTGP